MEVFVVEPVGYDRYGIVGIYDALDTAMIAAGYPDANRWTHIDGEWITDDADAISGDGAKILQMLVQRKSPRY